MGSFIITIIMCNPEVTENKEESSFTTEDRVGRLTSLMKQVHEYGQCERREDILVINRRLLQISTEIDDIHDDLVNLVKTNLNPRQIQFLEETKHHDNVDMDPSVQFFGVEWNGLFAKCFQLGLSIRIFKQRLSADCVDVSGLACILSDLRWIQRQMNNHEKYVSSWILTPTNIAANNLKNPVKYQRKHKTEDLSRKLVKVEDNSRKRKSSFFASVSNLLNYVKQ